MQKKYCKLTSGFIFFVLFCATVFAATTTQTAGDELAQFLDNTHTMQAVFKQSTLNNKGVQVGQKILGSMMLERPGKFRWETTQPNKQLIIINADKSLLYDADLAQLTKRKVDYKKPGSPAMLLSGTTEMLKKSFKIVKLKNFDNEVWFELRPKHKVEQSGGYQWVKMYFVGKQLKMMRIASDIGQQVEICFGNIILNAKLSKNKFVFVLPPNVDVLDEG